MRIYQFIDAYCKDLVENNRKKKSMINLSSFPHDAEIIDAEGKSIPVVFVDGENVPISDLFTMDKEDFTNTWKLPSAGEVYDAYLGVLEVLEGADALNRVRTSILTEQEKLATEIELVTAV